MKTIIFFISFLIMFSCSFSQDIDIFQKKKNDNFKFEDINTQMSFTEYSLLSRDLRMKEMMYAVIVPGYVHFYAKDNITGFSLTALRITAYGELIYLSYNEGITLSLKKNNLLSFKEDDIPKENLYATYGSIFVIIGTYLYDWIHGQYILKKKQERIRYKYNMKMNLSIINIPNTKPITSLSFNFQF